MKTLEEFNQQKQQLIEKEGKLAEGLEAILNAEKDGGVLPKSACDKLETLINSLYEKKQALETDRFYIAISGAIKSGKSTLLNALLFKKDVLSCDPTPCTAKLTIMEKADTKEVTAQFYSAAEWEEWKKSAASSVDDGINKEDMEIYIEKGGKHSEKLGKTETISEENLKDYTAREGELMPLVNTITIHDPEISLDGAQIVDTPGTNDPVVMRSKIAEEYIKKADAIIYALYSGKALTESDRAMLQDIIIQSGKNANNLIFAVTKKDTLKKESFDGKINQVFDSYFDQNLAAKEKGGKMSTDLSKCPRVFVSGEAARIAQDKAAKVEFDEARELRKDELGEFLDDLTPEYILKYSGIAELKEKIETYLIENKKEVVIDGNTNFIEYIKEACREGLFADLDKEFKEKLASIQKKISEIDAEIKVKVEEISRLDNKRTDIMQRRSDTRLREEFTNKLCESVIYWLAKDMEREITRKFGDSATAKIRQQVRDICNNERNMVAELENEKGWFLGDARAARQKAEAIFERLKVLGGLVRSSWRDVKAAVSEATDKNLPKITKFLKDDFETALAAWRNDMADVLKGSIYADQSIIFPEYKIAETVNELKKSVSEKIMECVRDIQVNTQPLSTSLGNLAQEAIDKWFSGPTQNEVIEKYISDMTDYINGLEVYALNNIEATRQNVSGTVEKIKEELNNQLSEDFFDVRKELFDGEFDAAIEQIRRKTEESAADLETIKKRKSANEAEEEAMRAEYNAKIAKIEEYRNKIENI